MKASSAFVTDQCVGIIGLGLVGTALATRLKKAGYRCIGFDVRNETMLAFETAGFKACESVNSILNQTNTLVLAVFDTSGVLAVVEQIQQHRKNQTKLPVITLIDCSTGDPVKLAELAPALVADNIQFIEAPLSGSSVQIENVTLYVPYFSTVETTNADGSKVYSLQSIYGSNKESKMKFS